MPTPTSVLGITLQLTDPIELNQAIAKATAKKPVHIATANPEFVLDARRNAVFATCLAATPYTCIDGTGLYYALRIARTIGKIPKTQIITKMPGADLLQQLLATYADGSRSFFFIGSTPEVLQQAIETITQQYPTIVIAGSHWGGIISATEPLHALDSELAMQLQQTKPDIVIVGMGAAKQELLMQFLREADSAPCPPVAIGVGGALRFYGSRTRAPLVLRKLGLEWLYRGVTEKGHLRRALRATFGFGSLTVLWLIGLLPSKSS
jgi:N-acetylglucosaminyldiphosphoundecaprenol N-acetyl-beta-D-mannosaminyltransferase